MQIFQNNTVVLMSFVHQGFGQILKESEEVDLEEFI
jgi:hypothetical protein